MRHTHPLLVLFDIDGTLLHGRPDGHTRALVDAMHDVWGVATTVDDVWAIGPAGRTDREIARRVLRGHGVDDARIDRLTPEWIAHAAALHERLAAGYRRPVAAPDAGDVTGRLCDAGIEIALVTGNLQAIGRSKVAAAGLGHRFGDGGGFGCDSEVRADLVRIARGRAARPYADDEVVVVGDTPRDVIAARDAGVRVVAVTTGAHSAGDLAGADAVVSDLTGALGILLA